MSKCGKNHSHVQRWITNCDSQLSLLCGNTYTDSLALAFVHGAALLSQLARQTLVDVDSRVTSQTKLVKHGCERPRSALKHPQVKGGCKRGEKHERSFCVGHEAVKSCRAGASEVPTAGTKHRQLEV